MGQIVWTKLANNDLENIYDFIALESPFYAETTINTFFFRVEVLRILPRSGREIPEFKRTDLRELVEADYRNFYRIGKGSISTIRVHHSARRVKRRLPGS